MMSKAIRHRLDDDIKTDIAKTVSMFSFFGVGGDKSVERTVFAQAVLLACGIRSRLVAGAMLYRAGPHPTRDTLRLALENNQGGVYRGAVVGHVWNEYGRDLIDFSSVDWQSEADLNYSVVSNPADVAALGPLDWQVNVPPFIWQRSRALKAAWRKQGEPKVGGLWYGGWSGRSQPRYAAFDADVARARLRIAERVAELRLLELIAVISG